MQTTLDLSGSLSEEPVWSKYWIGAGKSSRRDHGRDSYNRAPMLHLYPPLQFLLLIFAGCSQPSAPEDHRIPQGRESRPARDAGWTTVICVYCRKIHRVSSKYWIARSGRFPAVVREHATESFPTMNAALRKRYDGRRLDALIFETLVVLLGMIMRHVFSDST